jgi:hypothetical protein
VDGPGEVSRSWSWPALRTFLEHASNDRWLALWTLFAATGTNPGKPVPFSTWE